MKTFYKIVQLKDGEFLTLFHGIGGTRKLEVGVWIEAEIKDGVSDGVGTKYTSGLHVMPSKEETVRYIKKFRRNDRVVVECYAEGLRRKEHSRHEVYLADRIKILSTKIIQL